MTELQSLRPKFALRRSASLLRFCLAVSMASLPIQTRAAVEIGSKFPRIQLKRIDSSEIFDATAALKDKVILVDVWGADCPPCRRSLPKLNAIRKDFKARGFEIVGINVYEDLKDVREFLKEHPVDYVMLDDSGHEFVKDLGVTLMPTSFLLNRKGVVRFIHRGFRPDDPKRIRSNIEAVLKRPAKNAK